MADFTIKVEKEIEFTINELAIIKDEIESMIMRKHPKASLTIDAPDLDALIATQDKVGYSPKQDLVAEETQVTAEAQVESPPSVAEETTTA